MLTRTRHGPTKRRRAPNARRLAGRVVPIRSSGPDHERRRIVLRAAPVLEEQGHQLERFVPEALVDVAVAEASADAVGVKPTRG